ncbi:phage/plasmid primase, P4 family [Parasphingorhabdus sp.]
MDKGGALNEGFVKMVTGEDPVSARHLNKGFFVFDYQFKITISGNNKPVIKDTTDSIWSRMQLTPWDQQIPKSEIDPRLKSKLQAEADGIFAWLMRGLVDWRKNGLIEPDAVKMATSKYRDDSDTLGKFLRQCCLLGQHSKQRMWRVKKTDLFMPCSKRGARRPVTIISATGNSRKRWKPKDLKTSTAMVPGGLVSIEPSKLRMSKTAFGQQLTRLVPTMKRRLIRLPTGPMRCRHMSRMRICRYDRSISACNIGGFG